MAKLTDVYTPAESRLVLKNLQLAAELDRLQAALAINQELAATLADQLADAQATIRYLSMTRPGKHAGGRAQPPRNRP